MEINEVTFRSGTPVDGYGPGFFRLGDHKHEGPLAIFPGGPVRWPGLPDISLMLERADDIDVLLIGMGPEIAPLPAELRTALEEAGIGVEIMATPPACRTYNVLLAEERRVALAAMPV